MYFIINKYLTLFLLSFILIFISCSAQPKFKLGNERLIIEESELISNKKVGIVINHTSVLSNGTSLIDTLISLKICDIRTIFTPEHDLFGDIEAGKIIDSKGRFYKGIPVKSLYGKNKKPQLNDVKNLDILLFDIQDLGARFYTYISTMYYCIESAAETNTKIIIADRPNAIGGARFDGPVLDPQFKSFIGINEIPVIYGMTIGELAHYFNFLIFESTGKNADLSVVKMEGYQRDADQKIYFNNWINPSPNIPSFETAQIYPATCFIEGTNVSEGRGTVKPFLQIGAPFINSAELLSELEIYELNGLQLTATEFTPVKMKSASSPKCENEKCYGIEFRITDHKLLDHMKIMLALIKSLLNLYPNEFEFKENHFTLLAGNNTLIRKLKEGISIDGIRSSWQNDLKDYSEKRKKFLLY